MIYKSRRWREKRGIWSAPDAPERSRLNPSDVQTAVDYYTKDEYACSRQSPNKKDVVSVSIDGNKQYAAKRFMTRSVRETYRLFKEANPDTPIGLSKFYSLRPKWVLLAPQQQVCLCIYCANATQCISALEELTEGAYTITHLEELCLCTSPTTDCFLGDCDYCANEDALTTTTLGIPEETEVNYAVWQNGDLVKKTAQATTFLRELGVWLVKWITHDYIRGTQASAIHDAKRNQQHGSRVFHFDFAENWTAVVPNEVQSYHWPKKQVSLFTCVVTSRGSTQCFAVISDDVCHDAAHACFALEKICECMKEELQLNKHVTYVSDGASSHFKNKYQLYELSQKEHASTKWLFLATGRGKNACDGVGGLVKHQASLYNLTADSTTVIRSASEMVAQMTATLKNVKLLYADAEEVGNFRRLKKNQWKSLPRVPGIRSWHIWLSEPDASNCDRVVLVSRTAAGNWKGITPFSAYTSAMLEVPCALYLPPC
ncbi:uncharacterized protein LOC142570720 [Dermacentor variabilis]|uniref:uncharacterized protein LOC142570720 n=1 Tax=Dermacentor variabilis TaxID=34621 RepID=UPI003F5C08AE